MLQGVWPEQDEMHVISRKKQRDFWARHPDADSPLRSWFAVTKRAEWWSFANVRDDFPCADQVGRFTVFNIGRNKQRLIAVIRYNRQKVYIRHILTHPDYDKGKWKSG